MSEFIPVNTPSLTGNERKYVLDCLETGWISSEGSYVNAFEEAFAARVGRKHGIAVANGTAALEVAITSLELPKGSEVIIPAFTIISCALAVVRAGLIPVFVDADPLTWNMDVSKLETKITARTRAIMPVHIYGLPVDMQPVIDLADKHNLYIIEDAAEQIGQTYNEKVCGSFGTLSTFSFYPNKHITTGEGGMIVTDDDYFAERCRSLRNLCFAPERRFLHRELGYNYRMTNLQAALGLAQLEQLDFFIEKKRNMGSLYHELLSGVPGLQLPLRETKFAQNIYWVFGVVLEKSPAINLIDKLKEMGIGTRPFFYPMHQQPVFQNMSWKRSKEQLPVAEHLSEMGLYLPSGLSLTELQIKRVCDTLKEILQS